MTTGLLVAMMLIFWVITSAISISLDRILRRPHLPKEYQIRVACYLMSTSFLAFFTGCVVNRVFAD